MWSLVLAAVVTGAVLTRFFGGGSGSSARVYWPVVPQRAIISPFGASRDGGNRIHAGTDCGAFAGDKIIAMGPGEVLWPVSGYRIGANLQAVAVRHEDADYIYAEIEVTVVAGQKLAAGEQIGIVRKNGDGNAMLHLEAWEHGKCPKGFTPWIDRQNPPPGLLDSQARLKGLIEWKANS